MISIANDDYETIVEVRRAGLSELPSAIFEKDLLVTKILDLLQAFNWDEFYRILWRYIIIQGI